MRGTSAKSLETVLAVIDTASGGVGELGAQLFGVVDVLDQSPALRRVLTDPSTTAEAKRQLVHSVFDGRVSSEALSAFLTAVDGRWAAGRDLADGLEQAGVAAYVRAAEVAGEAPGFSDDLFAAGQAIAGDPDLRRAVSDKAAPAELKKRLLARVLEGKIADSALAVVQQAAAARTGSFEKVLERFDDLVAQRRGNLTATVRVAYPLADAERERLASALRGKYGNDVQLNLIVDPTVVGGIAVAVDDEVVDATMSTRLEAARRALAG